MRMRNFADRYGGAIYTEHSLALDSVVIENSIGEAVAALPSGSQYPGQTLTITNSQFFDNTAVETVPPVAGTRALHRAAA